MIEVADILRQYGASRRASHTLLPSQERALRDIENCRTDFFGGHVAQCDHCGLLRYANHSCRNRQCPKCHGQQAEDWLERQRPLLLPVPHFLLTFTLPAELRTLAFGYLKLVHGALLRCAAASVIDLAADSRWLGGTPTVLAVLHTWTRAMMYHPNVHLMVSAGGQTLAAHEKPGLPDPHPSSVGHLPRQTARRDPERTTPPSGPPSRVAPALGRQLPTRRFRHQVPRLSGTLCLLRRHHQQPDRGLRQRPGDLPFPR
ncbi:MAG: transposase zinc-binding domain-containing protein [Opitutaceae bacterium]|nr:transposase zinc-binding domain-containing protein [Opitutaceae bacterium]